MLAQKGSPPMTGLASGTNFPGHVQSVGLSAYFAIGRLTKI